MGILRKWRAAGWLVPVVVLAVAACEEEGVEEEPSPTEPELSQVAYLGSENCGYCHSDIYAAFRKSGHPYKLTKVVGGQAPTYPFSAVPSPPAGVSWSDVTYVIGGFGWKARFLGKDGYIITAGGKNQYNLATRAWSDYEKDTKKPYNCGPCHTTGYRPDGHQDGLPGIVGRWAFPGIQCERCHGPGSLHAQAPQSIPMAVDTRSELCGDCHNRGGKNERIMAKGGFIQHHEQYNELQASSMRVLSCVTCHDPHTGVLYNDLEGANALKLACEDCHKDARKAIQAGPLAAVKGNAPCVDCHMPRATKSAVAAGKYVGDIRTHLFKINSDPSAQQFSADGSLANPYLTLEFACLGCHGAKDKAWAAANASRVHGESYRALPVVVTAER